MIQMEEPKTIPKFQFCGVEKPMVLGNPNVLKNDVVFLNVETLFPTNCKPSPAVRRFLQVLQPLKLDLRLRGRYGFFLDLSHEPFPRSQTIYLEVVIYYKTTM